MEFLFSLSINKYKILAIFWNVFLALIPCFTVYYMSISLGKKKWRKLGSAERFGFVFLFVFWLLMLPNAAYLFTIPRHLVNYCAAFDKYRVCHEGTSWMVLFFVFYSLLGVPTFYYALKKMSELFSRIFSKLSAFLLPAIAIPLTSIALMFGLLSRFNSWDVLKSPSVLVNTALSYFLDFTLFFNFFIFTVILYLVYYGFDWFIWKVIKK